MSVLIVLGLLFILLLEFLIRFLLSMRQDSMFKQNLVVQGAWLVGGEFAPLVSPDIYLYRSMDDMGTIIEGAHAVPNAPITRSFALLTVSLMDVESSALYETCLDKEVVIGRADAVQLHLNDPKVSAYHCKIWRNGDKLMLEDMGSTNHTYLNNNMVNAPMQLTHGDMIRIGEHTYCFHFDDM